MSTSERYIFTTREAAQHLGKHPDTIRKALEARELHGAQRTFKGRWTIERDCLDAWRTGRPCTHAAQLAGTG